MCLKKTKFALFYGTEGEGNNNLALITNYLYVHIFEMQLSLVSTFFMVILIRHILSLYSVLTFLTAKTFVFLAF
jgi:hypothetical protein